MPPRRSRSSTPKISLPGSGFLSWRQHHGRAGHSAAEITAAVRELIPKVRASFVVDTLVYLWRGGRCNAVAALDGSALRLHPKIVVGNGAMHATKKYRGKIDNAIMSYVKDMEPT